MYFVARHTCFLLKPAAAAPDTRQPACWPYRRRTRLCVHAACLGIEGILDRWCDRGQLSRRPYRRLWQPQLSTVTARMERALDCVWRTVLALLG